MTDDKGKVRELILARPPLQLREFQRELPLIDVVDQGAEAILRARAVLRDWRRQAGLEPEFDEDGFEARALLIREQITMARDCLREGDGAQAVEHAIRATFWLSDLNWLDLPDPDLVGAIRKGIRGTSGGG